MPRREPAAYVWDVLDACSRVEHVTAGADLTRYLNEEVRRLAAERLLIKIGEAMNRLSKADAGMAAELGDVAAIVAFRNVLVHRYFDIDHTKVWEVITTQVPALHKAAGVVWARFAPLYENDDPGANDTESKPR
jgi:uncharacterized protein with HEPN domain